jgi:hypothetical protein
MSRTRLLLQLVSLAVAAGSIAGMAQEPQNSLEQQLIAADRGLLEAQSGAHPDIKRYEQCIAPDYVDISFGKTHSREESMNQLSAVSDFTFQYENPHAVVLSPTSGYVIAEVTYSASLNGFGVKNHILATTVLSLDGHHWVARLQSEQPLDTAPKAVAVPDSDPTLVDLRQLAAQVDARVKIPGIPPFPTPRVSLDGGMQISYSNPGDNSAHETLFNSLPAPMQGLWNQWASYTKDQPSGESLFNDMFHRFFFVHELGHLIAGHVVKNLPESERKSVAENEANNRWEAEMVANRISVAWFREHDPAYLAKLVADFHLIQAQLPNPVPAGTDKKTYFTENYQKLGSDPLAYGWYQLQMVIMAYDEPASSFQQVVESLPRERYE